ncbi:hypothetical protein [Halovivax gelatinilyticus]|uniref:hypothetical protein n=1 Tax=Halovivax gelatinilyticus TaxID=2961597 RepID=UPI0020CA546A|nr:hypothetical protein [Halovivax gelatinilyticus]
MLDFVVFDNQDTSRGYAIDFEVLDGERVSYETELTLQRAPKILPEERTERDNDTVPDHFETEAEQSFALLDDGWSRTEADHVARARIPGADWETVDVKKETDYRYLGILFVVDNGTVSAPFVQHYDDPEEAYYR